MRTLILGLGLPLVACAGHHHHWTRADTSHDVSHLEWKACEAQGTHEEAEACMRDKGFVHEMAAPRRGRPALESLPRLPPY